MLSNTPMINMRTAITAIPLPITLHNFFSLYFAFSSLEAVLYPEISQLPRPRSKTMENTANTIKAIHTTQSGPAEISFNFIRSTSAILILQYLNRF